MNPELQEFHDAETEVEFLTRMKRRNAGVKQMAIEYAKILGRYISEGLSENEEVFIKETLKKLIEQEIDMLEKEKERYKKEMEIFEEKNSLKSEEFVKKFDSGKMGDDLDFFEWYAFAR